MFIQFISLANMHISVADETAPIFIYSLESKVLMKC